MQVLLSAPDITCEHCIAAIQSVAEATDGVAFVSGDHERRSFVVDLASGGALDRFSVALAAEGYPLGDLSAEAVTDEHASHGTATSDWRPASYRVERTEAGANVNYDCYCGCDAGFALDRGEADPAPESCCCGNHILVGVGAGSRIAGHLERPDGFRVDVQTIAMPWGQPLEVALAIPIEG